MNGKASPYWFSPMNWMALLFISFLFMQCTPGSNGMETDYFVIKEPKPGGLPQLIEEMAAGDSVRIACYGNSITYGMIVGDPSPAWEPYPRKLQSLFQERYDNANIEVLNCGTPGFTAAMANQSVDTAVLQKQPDFCFLMLGINDCLNGISVEAYGKQMEAVITKLQQADIEVCVLPATPVVRSEDEELNEFRDQARLLAEKHNCAYLDLYAQVQNRMKTENLSPLQVLPDEVHFAQDKYGWIAEIIDEYVAELTP